MIVKHNLSNIDDFYRYIIDFKPVKGNGIMTLFLDKDSEEIVINITGDAVNHIDTYLCDKTEFNDNVEFKNGKMYIQGKECIIIDADTETNEEFNLWCERLEMEEWID